MIECYVALGGNQEKTLQGMREALSQLAKNETIADIRVSKVYLTSPVGSVSQPHFLNAVCRFSTHLSALSLWATLEFIERYIGKTPKPKNASRLIDLDLIFYGSAIFRENGLCIPHPKWHERLFVLTPLRDVTDRVPISDEFSIEQILSRFKNPHHEKIKLLPETIL